PPPSSAPFPYPPLFRSVLMSQMTAQVFFVLERAEDALLVPMAALGPVRDDGASRVHVVGPGAKVEQRPVTVGVRDRISAQVLSRSEEHTSELQSRENLV